MSVVDIHLKSKYGKVCDIAQLNKIFASTYTASRNHNLTNIYYLLLYIYDNIELNHLERYFEQIYTYLYLSAI